MEHSTALSRVKASMNAEMVHILADMTKSMVSMTEATTYKRFTMAKYELLKKMVASFPIGVADCPYCVDNWGECYRCEFGKACTPCLYEGSDYRKVSRAKVALHDACDNLLFHASRLPEPRTEAADTDKGED